MSSLGRWVVGVTVVVGTSAVAQPVAAQSPRCEVAQPRYACDAPPEARPRFDAPACAEPSRGCWGDAARPLAEERCELAPGPRGAEPDGRDEGCGAPPPQAVWGRDEDEAPACGLPLRAPRRAPSSRREERCERDTPAAREPAGRVAEPREAPRYAVRKEPLSEGLMYGAVPLLIGGTLGLIGGAVTVAKADSNACETNTSSPECGGADKSVGAGVLGASSTAILVGVAFVAIGGLEVQIVEPSYAGGAVPSVALRGTGAELSWAF